MIGIETIGTNKYAPQGSEAVNLYSTGAEGGSGLTIGQLVIAVSIRSAAAYEAQSVVKMNAINANAEIIDQASGHLAKVANGSADWAESRAFCIDRLGVEANALPSAIDTYAKRMTAVAAMKTKIDTMTQRQQQDMIDLQTLVNRRDVSYSASSNIVRALGNSQNANAVNF